VRGTSTGDQHKQNPHRHHRKRDDHTQHERMGNQWRLASTKRGLRYVQLVKRPHLWGVLLILTVGGGRALSGVQLFEPLTLVGAVAMLLPVLPKRRAVTRRRNLGSRNKIGVLPTDLGSEFEFLRAKISASHLTRVIEA
jgi:hypothetical protein